MIEETQRFDAAFWRSDNPYALSADAPVGHAPRGHLLVSTSGSEGRPRWVALSREAMLASAESVNVHLQANAHDRWLIALPITHVGGFAIYARAFACGASVRRIAGKWDAARFAASVADAGITLASLVPTQVFDLVAAKICAPPCLRAIVVGGGSLGQEVGSTARALGWPVLQSYGMTETCSQIATEPLRHLQTDFEPGALEVLRGWECDVDSDGLLGVSGPALASGVIARSDDGQWDWNPITAPFVTRDFVTLRAQGDRQYLRYEGRAAHALKIMGELVHWGPLQARLDQMAQQNGCPGQCALVPMPDPRRDTVLVLAHTPGVPVHAVMAAYAERAAPLERIERTVLVPAIPRSELGKLRLNELRALIQQSC